MKQKWGEVNATNQENISFSLQAARLWFPIVNPSEDPITQASDLKKRVLESLPQWFEIFEECFEVITSQDLSGYNPVKSFDSWVQFFFIDDHSEIIPTPTESRTLSFLLRGGSDEPASKEQFTLSLRRFNKAVDLPAISSGTGQKSVQQQFDG